MLKVGSSVSGQIRLLNRSLGPCDLSICSVWCESVTASVRPRRMNRNRKRKELSLMEELRELELLEEGETVDIPDLEIEDLIEENTMSVIVHCLNPYVHKVGGPVKALPPIWGMEERVRGRGVGEDRAQFIFTSARDLQHVLTKGQWFVNGWMVSMNQWTPTPGPEFLQRIPF